MSSWVIITLDTSERGVDITNAAWGANRDKTIELHTYRDPFGETDRSKNPYLRIWDYSGEYSLQRFLNNIPCDLSRYTVATANDTVDGSNAYLYEIEGRSHEHVDTIEGDMYEFGDDVAEEAWEQYGFDIAAW